MRLGIWRWAGLTAILVGLKACGGGDGGGEMSGNEGGAPPGAGGEPVAMGGEATSRAGAASLGGSGNVVPMPVACEPPVAGEPGQLDPSFEPGAKSLGDFSPSSAEFDRKGRLLVVGAATFDMSNLKVARFLADGTPDPEFSGDGIVSLLLRSDAASFGQVAVDDEQGRVWVGGAASMQPAPDSALLFRLLENGALDTSFNPESDVPGALYFRPRDLPENLVNADAAVRDFQFGPDGVWVHGEPYSFLEHFFEDGSLDSDFQPANAGGGRLGLAHDTLFLPGGSTHAYNLDGSPRLDFGVDGVLELERPDALAQAFAAHYALPQGPDKVLLVEQRVDAMHVARVTLQGELDANFGIDGFSEPFDCRVEAVATVCDGKILIVGEITHPLPDPREYCAVVLTPDGQRIEGTPDTGHFAWLQGAPGEVTSSLDAAIDPVTGSFAFIHGNTGSLYVSKFNLP